MTHRAAPPCFSLKFYHLPTTRCENALGVSRPFSEHEYHGHNVSIRVYFINDNYNLIDLSFATIYK